MSEESSPIVACSVVMPNSGGMAMTVESVENGQARCFWADTKARRIRRETLAIAGLRLHDPYADVGMLIIEGVTHTSDEIAILKEQGNA